MAPRFRNKNEESPQGLQRTALTAANPVVSLTQLGAAVGTLRVNLQWSSAPMETPGTRTGPMRGFFSVQRLEPTPISHARTIDLDLGCLYEFTTGQKGVVQSMGNRRGAFDRPPFVRLDRDDRSGSASGENLFINLDHAAAFRRLLIFAYIYSGAPAFGPANAVTTLYPSSGAPIEVRLDATTEQARSCAVALLTYADGDLRVRREVRYVAGYQGELDRLYRWGLRWAQMTKTG